MIIRPASPSCCRLKHHEPIYDEVGMRETNDVPGVRVNFDGLV
jgi:hypothetical protein